MNERDIAQWYTLQSHEYLKETLSGIAGCFTYGSAVSYNCLPEAGKLVIRHRYAHRRVGIQHDGDWSTAELVLPYSEVCVSMGLAGKRATVKMLSERSAQIYVNGEPFSSAVTLGEAGIMQDSDGYYYRPGF